MLSLKLTFLAFVICPASDDHFNMFAIDLMKSVLLNDCFYHGAKFVKSSRLSRLIQGDAIPRKMTNELFLLKGFMA